MTLAHGPSVVTDGVVVWLDAANGRSYPGSGSSWFDLSSNGNNCSLINSPVYSTTNAGYFSFNGTNNDATFGSTIQPSTITVSIWVRPATATLLSGYHVILDKESGTGGWYMFLNGGYPEFFANGDSHNALSNLILTNSWYCLTGTYDGATICIYVNGVLTGSTAYSGGMTQNSNPIEIMNRNPTYGKANTYISAGAVSQVQIYNRALSSFEIAQNFEALRGRYGI